MDCKFERLVGRLQPVNPFNVGKGTEGPGPGRDILQHDRVLFVRQAGDVQGVAAR